MYRQAGSEILCEQPVVYSPQTTIVPASPTLSRPKYTFEALSRQEAQHNFA
jgi:hypothetical protein